ncbi:hypothetical protein [Bradyrhizobium sp. SRL28]|uniref:hypothetical protein n=1 Tax=Bradyrhizobium sp. SRL28 TaxID=2836178 RepID=UPI0027E03926|nr:hypothetical protein [Bradyrhizobium sp. SRL28]
MLAWNTQEHCLSIPIALVRLVLGCNTAAEWSPAPHLEGAATYIVKLPKAEHSAPEWQAAMETLILVAETGGPTMLARIGVMRALNRHVERVFNPDRKETHWGKRKLKRDQ